MSELFSYVADPTKNYLDISQEHKRLREELERSIRSFVEEAKGVPVALRGPYGSGKTQLLYHLCKFSWRSGIPAIYTYMEKLLPPQECDAQGFAEWVKQLVARELESLEQGTEGPLMPRSISQIALRLKSKIVKNGRAVLLVDEVEQAYKKLHGIVRTDDRNPMRAVLEGVNNGEAGFFLVMAFAPVSYYEFTKSEADSWRCRAASVPVLMPRVCREKFGEHGNFLWWVGRGRIRAVTRGNDLLQEMLRAKMSKQELRLRVHGFADQIGDIGGVSVIENLALFDEFFTRDPDTTWRLLSNLEPSQGTPSDLIRDIVAQCEIVAYDEALMTIDLALKECETKDPAGVERFISIILDALSSQEGLVPLFRGRDEWKEVFALAEEVALDFEGDEQTARVLSELQNRVDDFVWGLATAEKTRAGKARQGYCLHPGQIHKLFPFPVSSPNLDIDKTIEEQRKALSQQQTDFLASWSDGGCGYFFAFNEGANRLLASEILKEFMNEEKSLIIVSLDQQLNLKDLPPVAHFLKYEKRYHEVVLPRSLSDFVVSFLYWWVQQGKQLPLENIFGEIERFIESNVSSSGPSDKEKGRKARYYAARIKEHIIVHKPALIDKKYFLQDRNSFRDLETRRIGLAEDVIGFAFVDGDSDLRIMARLKDAVESSAHLKEELKRQKSGIPTALDTMVVENATSRQVERQSVLERIRTQPQTWFESQGLRLLAQHVEEEDFCRIPSGVFEKMVFKGLYRFFTSDTKSAEAQKRLKEVAHRMREIRNRVTTVEKGLKHLQDLSGGKVYLSHLMKDDAASLNTVCNIVESAESQVCTYTKLLLAEIVDQVAFGFEKHVDALEQHFNSFSERLKPCLEKLHNLYVSVFENEDVSSDVFDMLQTTRSDAQRDFDQEFDEVCRDTLKMSGSIDGSFELTVGDQDDEVRLEKFCQRVEDRLIRPLESLIEMDGLLRECANLAQGVYNKVTQWR
jgi:hypothetical protein